MFNHLFVQGVSRSLCQKCGKSFNDPIHNVQNPEVEEKINDPFWDQMEAIVNGTWEPPQFVFGPGIVIPSNHATVIVPGGYNYSVRNSWGDWGTSIPTHNWWGHVVAENERQNLLEGSWLSTDLPRNFNYELMFFCSPGKLRGEYDDCVPAHIREEAEKRRGIEDKLVDMMAEDEKRLGKKPMYCSECGKLLTEMPADGKVYVLQGDSQYLACDCGKGGRISSSADTTKKMSNLHQWSDGISPYMKCPWCGYIDVENEFHGYCHPYDAASGENHSRGTTQCGQCAAAGPTVMFVLAYNQDAELYDCESFRNLYLSELNHTPYGVREEEQ